MTTATEKKQDKARAHELLSYFVDHVQNGKSLLMITQENGKGITDYLRVQLVFINEDGTLNNAHLTWAMGKAFGYSLRDRNGYHYLAISGGGYSKANELARNLATFYGVDRIRYELN